jgi:hypothetical protein
MTKPVAKLIGADGNIFNLGAIAMRTLKRAKMHKEADEMIKRITSSKSYSEALAVISEYVEVE